MKGKEIKKEKKKEKSDGKISKIKSDYQKEKSSKQDFSANATSKK